MLEYLDESTFTYIFFGLLVIIGLICLIGFAVHARRLKKQNNILAAIARDVNEIHSKGERDGQNIPGLVDPKSREQAAANIHIENNLYGQDRSFDQEVTRGKEDASLYVKNSSRPERREKPQIEAERDLTVLDEAKTVSGPKPNETSRPVTDDKTRQTDKAKEDKEIDSLDFISMINREAGKADPPAEGKQDQDSYCVGKSGRQYTAREIEELISD